MALHAISIPIKFKRNGVQIGGNGIENMFVNIVLELFFKAKI
jgi:hypothetical protein